MKTIRRKTELPQAGTVYIYGTGQGGRLIGALLKTNPQIDIGGFIDSEKTGEVDGRRIYRWSDFQKEDPKYDWILVASMYFPEITQKLRAAGIDRVMNVYSVCQKEIHERRRTVRAWVTGSILITLTLVALAL